jgi:ribose transport system substrate-binding protein
VDWNAPALEIDAVRQIEIVDAMINRRVAGIVLAPVDKQALLAVVERAGQKGIPVAIFDSAIDTDKIVSYVASDNTEAGHMAARRMGEILGGKGKKWDRRIYAGQCVDDGTRARISGRDSPTFSEINIVALQFGMTDHARSMAVTENILAAHPDLAGVFADNESSSAGAAQALKSRGASQVKLVAFDALEQLIASLREGGIDSLVVQNPFRMGYESTRAMG